MRYICTSILGTLVLAASTAADVQYKDICLEPSLAEVSLATYIYMALLIACITVPMMLVLWLTLTVTLKKLSPFRITFNCVAVSMMINALLLGGMLFLVHFALEPKPLTNFPALGIWIMSYAACTLGYWWFLGRIPKMKVAIMSGKPNFPYYPGKKDPAIIAKRLPDGLNLRNSLYIALFMSALQQPYYYLVYTIFSDYNTWVGVQMAAHVGEDGRLQVLHPLAEWCGFSVALHGASATMSDLADATTRAAGTEGLVETMERSLRPIPTTEQT